jgi:TolA-binding protein
MLLAAVGELLGAAFGRLLLASCLVAAACSALRAADDSKPPADTAKPPADAAKPVAEEPAQPAAEEESLLYAEPFDEVTLDKENQNAVLKVFPIELPNRRVPKAPLPTDEIEVRLKEHPDQSFKIQWQSIKRIQLFEQMLMDEAARLIAAGEFDAAYEHFELLQTKYPKTTGVKESLEEYLWADALDSYQQRRYDQALALLLELHSRNPTRAELADLFGKVTARLVERAIKSKNFRAARGWLRSLAARYPDESADAIQKYDGLLQKQAKALKTKAEAQWKAGETALAWRSATAMLDLWPSLPGGLELAKRIHADHPTLVVAVGGLAPESVPPERAASAAPPPLPLDEWPLRRTHRLLERELVEIKGAGETGGDYFCPLGSIERRPQLAVRLRSPAPGVRGLTAPDVANCLVRLADPRSTVFDPAFAEMFVGANVDGLESLSIEMRSSACAPEGWLTRVTRGLPPGDEIVAAMPYTLASRSAQEARYTFNPQYALIEATAPREIVERLFDDSTSALVALRSGQVSIVGRLSLWEVAAARASGELTVEAFAFPTVHVLVPNRRKPLLANRTFRRGLEYAIDREGVLSRALLGGRVATGSQVVSGPFPRAVDDELHGYAYDTKIVPRPYNLPLARLLVGMALEETEVGAATKKSAFVAGPLVLVYPAESAARVAVLSIRRQLQAAGVDVTLKEIGAGQSPGGDFDLAYVELAMDEPAVDVWRLFGPAALGGPVSPYLADALAELQAAADWKAVCRKLQAIHQLVSSEVDVIPLWQIVEHMAYLPSVKGIGERPVTLYGSVESWQIELRISGK